MGVDFCKPTTEGLKYKLDLISNSEPIYRKGKREMNERCLGSRALHHQTCSQVVRVFSYFF